MFERFTDCARKVMALANQEAQRLNHEYIGTEHILLGILKAGTGAAWTILDELKADCSRMRTEIENLARPGPDAVLMGKLPQTPRAKKVVEFAFEESNSLNHNYIGSEHLLLGLLREHDSVAGFVLRANGVTLEKARAAITAPPPEKNTAWEARLLVGTFAETKTTSARAVVAGAAMRAILPLMFKGEWTDELRRSVASEAVRMADVLMNELEA